MTKRKIIIALLVATVMVAAAKSRIMVDDDGNRMLEMPRVPSELKTPVDRASYIAERFWDAMDFADTATVSDVPFMEQQFANFAFMLSLSDDSVREDAVVRCLAKAKEASDFAYDKMLAMADDYLGKPWSPGYDDELYIPFMKFAAAQGDDFAVVAQSRYDDMMKNRVGAKPADFEFVTREGAQSRLNNEIGKGVATLLIFYDPTCDDCHDLMRRMASNSTISRKISRGELRVVMVYAGEDEDLWKRDAATIPPNWTVGLAPISIIDDDELYVIPFTPSTYLIAPDGTIVYKNKNTDFIINKL